MFSLIFCSGIVGPVLPYLVTQFFQAERAFFRGPGVDHMFPCVFGCGTTRKQRYWCSQLRCSAPCTHLCQVE